MLNISGGTINGNIAGQGSSNTINFDIGSGTFTYGSAYGFGGINQVNINSGTVALDGANNARPIDVIGGMLAGTGTLGPQSDDQLRRHLVARFARLPGTS